MRRDAQRNETAILLHAGRLMALDPNVSMLTIARSAGVSRATLYARYPDREALAQATLEAAFTELKAAFARLADDARRPIEALRTLIVELAVNAHHYPMIVGAIGQNIDDRDVQSTIRALRDLVARGQADGELRNDVPTDLVLDVIMGSLAQVGRRQDAAQADDAGNALANLLLEGIAAPHSVSVTKPKSATSRAASSRSRQRLARR